MSIAELLLLHVYFVSATVHSVDVYLCILFSMYFRICVLIEASSGGCSCLYCPPTSRIVQPTPHLRPSKPKLFSIFTGILMFSDIRDGFGMQRQSTATATAHLCSLLVLVLVLVLVIFIFLVFLHVLLVLVLLLLLLLLLLVILASLLRPLCSSCPHLASFLLCFKNAVSAVPPS